MTRLADSDTLAAESSAGERTPGTPGFGPALVVGQVVNRYVVLGRLGAGGMGVVYVAYDPELDRKVALKLLHSAAGGSEGRTRLLTEAQALARLSHPNVVGVHDVGTLDEHVWLAMELIEGQTFETWMRAGTRTWNEVLDAVVAAAQGVAAAHAAGLVHRDVKPANLMMGNDGRLRVMDFGLARASARPDAGAGASGSDAPHRPAARERSTVAGSIVGTPAYMAPEQLAGLEVDARADQFSLCVVLWEALHGERPFAGETFVELAANVLQGQLRPVPRSARTPGWIRSVLRRALQVDRERRFRDVNELLVALTRGRAHARRRTIGVGAVVAVAAAATIAGADAIWHARRLAACSDEAAELDALWDDSTVAGVRAALIDTGFVGAADAFERTVPWIDAWTSSWRDGREEACRRGVAKEWSRESGQRSIACFAERRWGFEGLVAVLAAPDRETPQRAVYAAAGLPPVASCLDEELLARRPTPPDGEAERTEVREVLRELEHARSLGLAGRYDAALTATRPLLDRARALGWPPLVAEVLTRIGSLQERLGEYEEAETTLVDAYFAASEADDDGLTLEVASTLVFVVGYRLARLNEGLLWGRHAEGSNTRFPAPGLRTATLWNHIAILEDERGRHEEAVVLYERSLAVRQEILGPEHPEVAQSLMNIAIARLRQGRAEEAQHLHERVLEIRERTVGPEHPDVAQSLDNLANAYFARGMHTEAIAAFHRSLEIRERALGADHPALGGSLNNLANVHYTLGELDQAEAYYRRAMAVWEAAVGRHHQHIAIAATNLGNILMKRGSPAAAQSMYERAIETMTATVGADNPNLAGTLTGLGDALLAQGNRSGAIEALERALTLRETHQTAPIYVAETKFALARALWAAAEDRDRAKALATDAAVLYRDVGEPVASHLAEVEQWLTDKVGGSSADP